MNQYRIFTDSAVDMPKDLYQKYDLGIIPMQYTLNGESATFYSNSPDRDQVCDKLYQAMRDGLDVHTSQITPYQYIEFWKPDLEKGIDILHMSFSSGLSATWENAMSAAAAVREEYPDRTIRVVDTKAATAGQGVILTAALMNQEKGMAMEENALWVEKYVPYLCHRFTVGDLDYLHKGGRVSAAVALIGGMLKIKPMLIIDDEGKLQVVAKVRGRNAALKALVKSYQKEMGVEGVPKLVYISHTSQYEDAQKLKEMVQEVAEPGTLVETMCETPIIGVHTGPDFFSVCGFGHHRVEE